MIENHVPSSLPRESRVARRLMAALLGGQAAVAFMACTYTLSEPHPKAPSDPCANVVDEGSYCASSNQLHFDPTRATAGAVYDCNHGVTVRKASCGALGCVVEDAGVRDTCEKTSDPCQDVDSGVFCGRATGLGFRPDLADPETLYTCSVGHMIESHACEQGCQVAPTNMEDHCK